MEFTSLNTIHDPEAASLDATAGARRRKRAPRRYDVYAIIHKALRATLTDAMLAAGRLDTGDSREVTETVVRVRDVLDFCEVHLDKENRFVHPAMEARRPGSASRIAGEHVDHALEIAGLRRKLDALVRAPAATRDAVAHELYLALARFVGENLVHMHEEETKHNAVLWDAYSDEELVALENTIRSHVTPAQMQYAVRWMLPSMTPAERAVMLTEMRATAPAPVFGGVLSAARAHLDADGVRKLEAALAV